ncbi:MAG: hypothetical protein IJS65_05255, partial [Clostridia bacterium]|nr:hypothetical protein [Clostridia bacterium]
MPYKAAYAARGISKSVSLLRRLNIYANIGKGPFSFLFRKLRVLFAKISELDVHPRVSAKTRNYLKTAETRFEKLEYAVSEKLSAAASAPRSRFHAVILLICATAAI